MVVSNLADNPIGETDSENLAGNYISIDIGNNRFVILAHLQKESVLVNVGDSVHAGQRIAKCGNSGNTSQPHLHLQVQNVPEILADDALTYPMLFRDIRCVRSGRERTDSPFFVRHNDRLIAN
jgi:murein DD-endopeptidase MepM/ murein hydrolase activator NlpD